MENSSSYCKFQRKTTEPDTNELNKYFNETATDLMATKTYGKDKLKNLIQSFPEKNNSLQLHTVSYEDVAQFLKLLRNYCFTGYESKLTMFTNRL